MTKVKKILVEKWPPTAQLQRLSKIKMAATPAPSVVKKKNLPFQANCSTNALICKSGVEWY